MRRLRGWLARRFYRAAFMCDVEREIEVRVVRQTDGMVELRLEIASLWLAIPLGEDERQEIGNALLLPGERLTVDFGD